ncbi:MAG: hypothetical protein KGD67_00125 [Candidatus Lokiarchaeota archaeon]|nr:hypothetical protein [Candidatus Lokiarchaeota archaeon]
MSTIHSTLNDTLLFYQRLTIKKKFSNEELLLFHFFHEITDVFPQNLIVVNEFVFFFLKNENYFNAKSKLPYLRKKFQHRKIVIVREENILVNLVYGFFPDPYIHTVRIERNIYAGKRNVIVGFLSYEDRGIAVGCNGDYIKAVNEIFNRYVLFVENNGFQIRIKCEVVKI